MVTITRHTPDSDGTVDLSPPSHKPRSNQIKDKLGRILTIQEPSILQESRLVRTLGETASNAAYMTAYALPAIMVTAINDDEVFFPANQLQVDALIQRLGREGMGAVMDHIITSAEANTAGAEVGATIKK